MTSGSQISKDGSGDGKSDMGVQSPQQSPGIPRERNAGASSVSQQILSTVGRLVVLMMRSQAHQSTTLADLKSQIMPAVIAGQYSIVGKMRDADGFAVPVAAVIWARVSGDVDARLSADLAHPIKLTPKEWTDGDVIWIVEAMGEAPIVKGMLERLVGDTWKGRTVRLRANSDRGIVVQTLATAA